MNFSRSALAAAAAILCWAGVAVPAHAQDAARNTAAPAPDADAFRFDLLEFEIDGNTVLPVEVIERTVTPFLGPRKLMADVEAARTALEKAYQQAGYLTVFVDVPEQQVADGVVKLQVLEGRIERLMVTGSRYFSQGYIRSKLPEAAEGQVPNFNALQNQLTVVNRSEERRVQPVLRPGKAPGTVEMEMKVEDKLPLAGSVELNNLHAANTDPLRLNASLRHNNLFQRDHGLSLTAMVAPRAINQSRVFVAGYSIPRDNGDTVALSAVVSDSEVDTLGGTQVLGNGTTYGLRYIAPLVVRSEGFHSVTAGLDVKNLRTRVNLGGTAAQDMPLHYIPLSLGYNGTWAGAGSPTQLSVNAVASARRLWSHDVYCVATGSVEEEFTCNGGYRDSATGKVVPGRDRGFATLRMDLRHSEALRWGALGALNLRLSGQYSGNALVSAEQFAVGGGETVRGYLEAAAAGDTGWLTQIELRSRNFARAATAPGTPQPAVPSTDWLTDLTVLGFIDAAQVRLIDPAVGQRTQEDLLGVGLGLRISGRQGWTASLDVAQPVNRISSAPKREPRAHMRLGVKF